MRTFIALTLLSSLLLVLAACSDEHVAFEGDMDGSPSADGDSDRCTTLTLHQRGATQLCEPAGVRVVFSVTDCNDEPVVGLTAENIEIVNDENGKPFSSEGASSAITQLLEFEFYTVLAIDLSYSVVENDRLNDVLDGATAYINAMVTDQGKDDFKHNIALYVFGSTGSSELIQDFTKDEVRLLAAIDNLRTDPGRGSTNLYGAFMAGLDMLEAEGQSEKVVRSMILLTDGTHETGDEETLRTQALARLENTDVETYSIGIKGDYDPEKLKELASDPAENFMMVDRSSQLIEAFRSIAEGVDDWSRSNYSIGVCSPLEGSERSLTITVKKLYYSGDLTVIYDATGFNLTGCDSDWVSMGNNCRDMGTPTEDGDTTNGDTDGDVDPISDGDADGEEELSIQ